MRIYKTTKFKGGILTNENTENLVLEMFFYRFGLIDTFEQVGKLMDNIDALNPNVVLLGLKQGIIWLTDAVSNDTVNEKKNQHRAKFLGNISTFLTK